MKKASKQQITEQEVKALIHQPAGKAIIREAGRAFAGALFGKAPVLEHVSIKDHGQTVERETTRITGGVDPYMLSRIRMGHKIEKALKPLRGAYLALGPSASAFSVYGSPSALCHADYATAVKSLRKNGYPECEIETMIDQITRELIASMSTPTGRWAWALLCAQGYGLHREFGAVFQAVA